MRSRKFLSFLLIFLVLFVTFPNGVAFAAGTQDADGARAMTNCHAAMTASADMGGSHSHGGDASVQPHSRHDAPVDTAPQYDCCTGIGGVIISLTGFSLPTESAREAIPFHPSLRLSARITGIYHPPRQNA